MFPATKESTKYRDLDDEERSKKEGKLTCVGLMRRSSYQAVLDTSTHNENQGTYPPLDHLREPVHCSRGCDDESGTRVGVPHLMFLVHYVAVPPYVHKSQNAKKGYREYTASCSGNILHRATNLLKDERCGICPRWPVTSTSRSDVICITKHNAFSYIKKLFVCFHESQAIKSKSKTGETRQNFGLKFNPPSDLSEQGNNNT
jgi:hypothetical protein